MDKLVLGVAALALSTGAASAQVVYPGYGYAPYGSALRSRSSSIWLRSGSTSHGRNDHCYRDASSSLHSATGRIRVS